MEIRCIEMPKNSISLKIILDKEEDFTINPKIATTFNDDISELLELENNKTKLYRELSPMDQAVLILANHKPPELKTMALHGYCSERNSYKPDFEKEYTIQEYLCKILNNEHFKATSEYYKILDLEIGFNYNKEKKLIDFCRTNKNSKLVDNVLITNSKNSSQTTLERYYNFLKSHTERNALYVPSQSEIITSNDFNRNFNPKNPYLFEMRFFKDFHELLLFLIYLAIKKNLTIGKCESCKKYFVYKRKGQKYCGGFYPEAPHRSCLEQAQYLKRNEKIRKIYHSTISRLNKQEKTEPREKEKKIISQQKLEFQEKFKNRLDDPSILEEISKAQIELYKQLPKKLQNSK